MNRHQLGKWYQKVGIMKRDPVVASTRFKPSLQRKREAEGQQLVKMMKFCFREKIPIVYIDETGFSMRPIHRQEYTAPGRKIMLERSNTNQKNVTVSAAISANDGLIHFEMIEGGQTIPTYITFLINLRAKVGK